MGFYELGNGCDSCDTISSIIPNNVNMQMDTNSALAANMAYGAQANTVQQYNNTMGGMGNGSNGSTMGSSQQNSSAQPKVVKQIVTTTTTAVAPVSNNNNNNSNNNNSYKNNKNNNNNNNMNNNMNDNVEGFTDNMNNQYMFNDKKWIVLGLVIFTALASNECCKYFLNKSLQLNDGSPMYYVAYAGVAILLTMAANKYANSN